MLKIRIIPVTSLRQNCYLLIDQSIREAALVDPGGDISKIMQVLSAEDVPCRQIWVTHSHLDHCGGVKALIELTKAKFAAHAAEKWLRAGVVQYAEMLGVPPGDMQDCPEPDICLNGGEFLRLGDTEFQVIHTPGHSQGSLCYYCKQDGLVLVGDLLFAGSVGRTDLPGGSHKQLMESIGGLMKMLPPDTRVLPGHGPETTLEREKLSNPFLGEVYG